MVRLVERCFQPVPSRMYATLTFKLSSTYFLSLLFVFKLHIHSNDIAMEEWWDSLK